MVHAHYMLDIFEILVIYEIMWKNVAQPDSPQMTAWRMRIACWIFSKFWWFLKLFEKILHSRTVHR
jgi:hypothetical protein